MSDIDRLFQEVRAAVPTCAHVRVSHWMLRTTWQAQPVDGHTFTRAEDDKIQQIFASFVVGDEGGSEPAAQITPTLHQRMTDLERREKDLERRVLTLELRVSDLLANEPATQAQA